MGPVRALIIGTMMVLCSAWAAFSAEDAPRIALLVGNQNYTEKVGPLKNPHTDVALIEAALKRLGFTVTVIKEASYRDLAGALKRHVAEVRKAGPGAISFFYYSGHGVANPDTGINYLVPADVADANDPNLWSNAFEQSDVIEKLSRQAPQATHYVVFDACRNELRLSATGQKALGAEKGFAPVAQAAGLLIAYSTGLKQTASDAGEGGGPYARALAAELVKPGTEAVAMFRNVQLKVKLAIGQDPWLSFPSLPEVYLAGRGGEAAAKPAQPPARDAEEDAAREWGAVDKNSVAMLKIFLRRHGSSRYADYAQARIEELQPKPAKTAAAMPLDALNAPNTAPKLPDGEFCADGHLLVSVAVGKSPCIKPGSGQSFNDCPDCPEMVAVPAGSFLMGSTDAEVRALTEEFGKGWEEHFKREAPQHRVTIAKPFAVGRFAVTFAEWDACVADGGCGDYRPSDEGWGRDDRPVINVSWDDAQAYVKWLSGKTGKTYRLLSEAQFEYSARAGTATRFWWGNSIAAGQANFKDENGQKTLPVKSFQPNPWGLYQVLGNVWIWTADCWYDYKDALSTSSVRTAGNCRFRTIRGGSCGGSPLHLRAAYRASAETAVHHPNYGFRLARSLD